MIDIAKEKPIPCDELPSRYPDHVPGRGGRPFYHVTIEMWRRRGVQGVTLETVMCGGSRCTSTGFRIAVGGPKSSRF
jgi:hypothetical protein